MSCTAKLEVGIKIKSGALDKPSLQLVCNQGNHSVVKTTNFFCRERSIQTISSSGKKNYQLLKMQGLLKLLLVCGILVAVAACTQAVAVSHAENTIRFL